MPGSKLRTRASSYSAATREPCSPLSYAPRIPDPYLAALLQKTRRTSPDSSTNNPLASPAPRIWRPSLSNPKPTRKRSSTVASCAYPANRPFTPAEIPDIAPSRCTISPKSFVSKKLPSFQLLHTPDLASSPPPYSVLPPPIAPVLPPRLTPAVSPMPSDTEDDDIDHDAIYTSPQHRSSSSSSLRQRIFGANSPRPRDLPKPICTTPGRLCAGETETETDEPSRHLPTARIVPPSNLCSSPGTPLIQDKLIPIAFEFSRLLSIVPAVVGTLYNLYHMFRLPTDTLNGRAPPERVDYFISLLWSILTGYQCLYLATGLLARWRAYYPPLSTLVRLLALQGICWPATQITLSLFEHEKRPVMVWAAIGTTTSISRSVQLWVTSNLWWDKREHASDASPSPDGAKPKRRAYWRRLGEGGKWGGRRWDWKEVGVKCALPAGVLYFIMAWAEQLRREFAVGC